MTYGRKRAPCKASRFYESIEAIADEYANPTLQNNSPTSTELTNSWELPKPTFENENELFHGEQPNNNFMDINTDLVQLTPSSSNHPLEDSQDTFSTSDSAVENAQLELEWKKFLGISNPEK